MPDFKRSEEKDLKFLQISRFHLLLDPLVAKTIGLIDRPGLGNLVQYDTTFNRGDVYVSVLIVRYLKFEQEPVQPFILIMHDKKKKDVHHTFSRKSS